MTLDPATTIYGAEHHAPGQARARLDGDAWAERRLAHARYKAMRDRPTEAEAIFQELLEYDPAQVAYHVAYAAFLARTHQPREARAALDEAIRLDMETTRASLADEQRRTPQAMNLQALEVVVLMRLGQTVPAQALLTTILAQAPDNGWAHMDQATLAEQREDWSAARHSYQAALRADPSNLDWRMAYGQFLKAQANLTEALSILQQAQAYRPNDTVLQAQLDELTWQMQAGERARGKAAEALFKLREGDVETAEAWVAEALALSDRCGLALRVKADLRARSGQLAQAEALLVQALVLEPGKRDYQTALDDVRRRLADRRARVDDLVDRARRAPERSAAFELLGQALREIADDPAAHVVYAELLWPDQLDQVESHLATALAVAPQHGAGNRLWALLLHRQGQTEAAESGLRAALTQHPHDEDLTDALAELLIQVGRPGEALTQLHAALAHGDTPRLEARLGQVWLSLGQADQALPPFEAALAAEPARHAWRRAYAQALRAVGRRGDAEDQLRETLSLAPDDADTHAEYASLLADEQRFGEARRHIERAGELQPGEPAFQASALRIREYQDAFERVEEELAYAQELMHRGSDADRLGAAACYDRAHGLAPDSLAVLRPYARWADSEADRATARTLWQRVLALNPQDREAADRLAALEPVSNPPDQSGMDSDILKASETVPATTSQSTTQEDSKAPKPLWERILDWLPGRKRVKL